MDESSSPEKVQYTQDLIELAVQQMLSPDVSVQQSAADFIENWKYSDDAYILAFAILTNSSHVYAQFYSMLVIKDSVARKWNQLPKDFCDSLRNYLYQSLSQFASGSHLFSSACDVISLIGVFDWPERWPSFLNDILSGDLPPLIQLSLLDRFTSTITDGIYVTHTRRAKLLGVILELSPQINQAVNAGLSQEESIPIAFSVLDTQLKTEALTQLLDEGIIEKLIELLPNEISHNGAIQCLHTIFIDRYDSFKVAPNYVPQVLRAFSVIFSETSFSSPALLLLVEKVLFKHSSFICYLLSGMESKIDVDSAFKNVKVENLEQTQSDIFFLLRVILLNKPDEKQIDVYWALWRCILPHLATPPLSELPISTQIKEILPLIHESLFTVLPLAAAEHTMIDTVARICWGTDVALFPEELSEFLKKQKPSIALCYAIGFAEKTFPENLITEIFTSQLDDLLQYFKANEGQDQDYAIALLFALSHSGIQQINNPSFFEIFTEIAMNCLVQNDETIVHEALRALQYVAKQNCEYFFQNENQLANSLCEKIQYFLEKLALEPAIRIVRLCSFLAESCESDQFYPLIVQPIYQMFIGFVNNVVEYGNVCPSVILSRSGSGTSSATSSGSGSGSGSGTSSPSSQAGYLNNATNDASSTKKEHGSSLFDRETAEFMLTLISETSPSLPSDQLIPFEEPMFTALKVAGSSNNFTLSTLELFVRAAACLVARRPPDEALEPLTQLYATLSGNYEKNYLLFDSVAIVRSIHPEVDPFFNKIETDFIIPLVGGQIVIDDCTSLFRMISFFSLEVFNMEVLTDLLVFGISHNMSIVTIAASKCARRVLRSFDKGDHSSASVSSLQISLISSNSSSGSIGLAATASTSTVPQNSQEQQQQQQEDSNAEIKEALKSLTLALLPPLIVSLTDGIHSTATGPLVHLLFDLFTKNEEFDPSCAEVAEVFMKNLDNFCQEPQPGVFQKVTDLLIQSGNDQRSFRHIVFDLLVTLRCATPCDLATFDTVVGPAIWMPDNLSSLVVTVTAQIEKQQDDERFLAQEMKELSLD